jgi:hypothetical protein
MATREMIDAVSTDYETLRAATEAVLYDLLTSDLERDTHRLRVLAVDTVVFSNAALLLAKVRSAT